MTFKRWIVGSPDRESAKNIASELGRDPFCVMLAQLRGITDINELDYYMSDEMLISSPDELIDVGKAADIINEYIEEGLKIAVFGDYDCDGVCASAIMYKYLKSRGADVFVYIPDRLNEGYGMNTDAVDIIFKNGCKLIVTVDNGISCEKEIDYAASLGIVTVVTDHHLPPDELPDAAAIVDPNRKDCPSSFKQICGAQVAFKLVCKIDDKEPEEIIDDYVDLLTVAIIADSMPLIKENHSTVKYGIRHIITGTNVAFNTILSVAGIDKSTLDSSKVVYGIAPRINAAGRMGDADKAFNFLISEDVKTALRYANEIENLNVERQRIEKEIVVKVQNTIESNGYDHDRVIVVSGKDFHIGVLGIVASKICEKYGRPTIIFSTDGDISKGSCRSLGNFNIYNALKNCEEHIEKYGGHAMAAGLTIREENLSVFRNAINDYAADFEPTISSINLDFKLNPSAISVEMVRAIRKLEPFGNENPAPLFGVYGATLKNITEISNGKHLRLQFEKDGFIFNALFFGVTLDKFCFESNMKLDLAVALDLNTFMNKTGVSIFIRGIRPSNIDQESIISDLIAVDNYHSRGIIDRLRLGVSRDEIGTVYRFLAKKEQTEEGLIYQLYNVIGVAKILVSIDILDELKLISRIDGKLSVKRSDKTELSLSKTYNILGKGGENGE